MTAHEKLALMISAVSPDGIPELGAKAMSGFIYNLAPDDDWRSYVPIGIHGLWNELSTETRLAVFLTAHVQARHSKRPKAIGY